MSQLALLPMTSKHTVPPLAWLKTHVLQMGVSFQVRLFKTHTLSISSALKKRSTVKEISLYLLTYGFKKKKK